MEPKSATLYERILATLNSWAEELELGDGESVPSDDDIRSDVNNALELHLDAAKAATTDIGAEATAPQPGSNALNATIEAVSEQAAS